MDSGAPLDCSAGRLPILTWVVSHSDYVGIALIVVMLVLVAWRAATRQVAAASEVGIGLLGVLVLFFPIITQLSFEAFGVKASASVRHMQCENINEIADIKRRVGLLESKLAPQSTMSQPAAKDVATLIYYLDTGAQSRRSEALRAQSALAAAGFQSALVPTDFQEITRSGMDVVKVFYDGKGQAFSKEVDGILTALFGDQVIVFDQISRISSGNIQVQIY